MIRIDNEPEWQFLGTNNIERDHPWSGYFAAGSLLSFFLLETAVLGVGFRAFVIPPTE